MKVLDSCLLYGFVDSAYLHGRSPVVLAKALCEGGVDIIQLRMKGAPAAEVETVARALLPVTRAAGVPLVINDHPRVAVRCGAEAFHLGQEDFSAAGVERVSHIAGRPGPLVGLSTHSSQQALKSIAAGADYIGAGPVFPTGTKPEATPVTLDYVRWAAGNVKIPWFAIGGINLSNLDQVLAAGARRICVISAIMNAKDVSAAARQFKERLLQAS